jgi:serine/threonine-protein kinase
VGKNRSDEPTQSERPSPLSRKKPSVPPTKPAPHKRSSTAKRDAVDNAKRPTVPDKKRAAPPSSPPPAGPTLYAGRYELAGLLGVGAMGSVYRARDVLLGETIALKVLRKDLAHSTIAVSRFHREAKLARRITHPNITRVFDVAEHEGEHYMTMECVEGESLHAMLDSGRPLGVTRSLAIALQLARALGAVHHRGVVHLDLKPENVVVESSGRAVLTDFGVSKAASESAPPPLPGHAGGTPIYMAPEQLEGREVSAKTDLYALGLLLFEMLTGTTPWGNRSGLVGSVARLAVPPKRVRELDAQIPLEVSEIVETLLTRDMEGRPESAHDVELAIEEVQQKLGDRPSAVAIRLGKNTSIPPPTPRAPAPIATTATPSARGIAVLPLRNLGDDKTQYVTEAMTTEIIERLALVPTLRVASRAAIEADERPNEDLRALGRRLGVEAILEGSLLVRGAEMRVSVRLVEVERGFVLWSARLDRPSKELFTVADEVIGNVVRALGLEPERGATGSSRRGPASIEDVDPFLRAQEAYGAYTADGARQADRLLSEAFVRAPKDPILASWLAISKLRRWDFEPTLGHGDESAPVVAERIAKQVIERNPNVGEAQLALALLAFFRGDAKEAMRRSRDAIRCTPTLAEAHRIVGQLEAEASTTYEGERDLDVSLRLDARQVRTLLLLARTRALKRDYERALEWVALAEARSVGHPVAALLRLQIALWRNDTASVRRERAKVLPIARDGGGPEAHALRALLGVNEEAAIGTLTAMAAAPGTTARRKASILKIIAEHASRAKDLASALSAARGVDAAGTVDLLWFERCPSLDALRSVPGFAHIRTAVQGRAADVLAATKPVS